MKQLLFTISLLFCLSITQAQTVINEYSCSNISTILDAFNEYEDWVELYNSGASAQNLTGYYLSDDPANLMKWQIPANAPLNSGGRQMVFCSGRGVLNGTQLHPDFKLTQTKG
ncbi:MAG TPA: lamin tail domain-containing protein, partial [Chitinophagaceae bacterium]|nr:lamin tail domain-containing protein [Chitinophagaceae bacterium]